MNKRLKKKFSRNEMQKKLISSGESSKQVSKKTYAEIKEEYTTIITHEAKKNNRNARRRAAYNRKKVAIAKAGLTSYVSPTISDKNFKKEFEKAKRKKSTDVRRERRRKILIYSGANPDRIRIKDLDRKEEDYKNVSRETFREAFDFDKDTVYKSTTDQWLYIGFTDESGNTSIEGMMPFYEGLTVRQLKEEIDYILKKKRIPDNSSGRAGATEIHINYYETIIGAIKYGEMKGYQSFATNEFTLHGFLKIECFLLDNCTEDMRKIIHRRMTTYIKENMYPLYKEYKKL